MESLICIIGYTFGLQFLAILGAVIAVSNASSIMNASENTLI